MPLTRIRLLLLTVLAGFAVMPQATAQEIGFPLHAISLVVPFPERGPQDRVARILADRMSKNFRTDVKVDNQDGADGTLGAGYVSRADPDGYKLLLGTQATHGIDPALYKTLPYDPVAGFAPISLLVEFPEVLLVSPDLPAATLTELIELLRANPGAYGYATAGPGTPSDLLGTMFKLATGVEIQPIAYKGVGPALSDLMNNHVAMMFMSLPPTADFIRNGRLRGLAVTGDARVDRVPDVPTMAEAGLPAFQASSWDGLFAPAGTPPARIEQLHKAVVDALAAQEVQDALHELGATVIASTPEQLATRVAAELARWAPVVSASGASVE